MTKNNHTIRYFVEIQPTGYYFFGNERTFMTAEADKYGETIANYFAESNDYPQQTGVLGMLRYTLLALYNQLNGSSTDKQFIIGTNNFEINANHSFGLIDKISPLVLYNRVAKTYLHPAGLDHQNYNKTAIHCQYGSSEESTYMHQPKTILPQLSNFDYKEEIRLIWKDSAGKLYTPKDIFREIAKVGVNKEETDKAFYKQTFKGLNSGFSFGVWVDFVDNQTLSKVKFETIDTSKLVPIFIPFGADQGLFKISFDATPTCIFSDHTTGVPKQIICLSDAWIEEGHFSQFDFGITQYTDFRFIKSQTSNYYNSDKTAKFILLKRGSVLYPNNTFQWASLNKSNFQRIGYNYFQTF